MRYLQAHRERATFSLGVAGRSQQKLKELAVDLGLGVDVKQFVVDVADEGSVERAVDGVRVVVNAVGPFYPASLPVARYVASFCFEGM